MAEVNAEHDQLRDGRGASRSNDLMVAVPAPLGSEAVSIAAQHLKTATRLLPAVPNIILALPAEAGDDTVKDLELPPDGISNLGSFRYVNYAWPGSSPANMPWLTNTNTYRAIFKMAAGLESRACTVLGTDATFTLSAKFIDADRLALLMGPGLDGNFDLVMPLYTTEPFDDLVNKSILYPLTCALYGHRVRNPLGSELQASARLLPFLSGGGSESGRQQARLLWPASVAANRNLKICQVHVGRRHPISNEGLELSDALEQMVSPLFFDMEDNAAFWQRIRGSHEVPAFGMGDPAIPPSEPVDIHRMIDAYQLGVRNLREIWSLVLPPTTLLELKKLALSPAETFKMPDALWARIVYDFSLAHRLRNIHRTHLFGALTPLYLGWVGSYAREINAITPSAAEERVEQVARAFETEKPYLLSRWRWPDRFHP